MFDFRNAVFSQIQNVETEPEIIEIAEKLRPIAEPNDELYKTVLEEALNSIRVNIGNSFKIENEKKIIPWFDSYYKELGHTRWERYETYLLRNQNFPKKVVQSMKENLSKIIELSGNPNGSNYLRKGLVIGDVQSGKTANYVGLMNLAADVKYKVIIVLTGTTNTLREQTQVRIEEGFGKAGLYRGVSEIDFPEYYGFITPVYLTSREHDFSKNSKKNFQSSVESTVEQVIMVTKKNATSLKNIHDWLVKYSKKKNNNKIDYSLMLIDDEADFASVNTREEDNPTIINKRIRSILQLFTKSSYIGFTATPYANIFIEPNTDDEMIGQDLFPSDYIYVLGESDDYLGVQKVFNEDPIYPNILQHIENSEVDTYLPLKHKKDDIFNSLSPSMKHAINVFLIANTIRDLRGKLNSHRSMLFNVSRFINLHYQIKNTITDYVDDAKRAIRLYSKLPMQEALKVPIIQEIKNSFEKEYLSKTEEDIDFETILKKMNDSIYRIKVVIVNADNKELDYRQDEDEGVRTIVVGGFALSRGLTLEGLMISYFYRNSLMYDSLLQMGRWFGYRNGYNDLCRIYMTEKVIEDFKFIALATKELKEDLQINSKKGLTPLDFGIKVRTGQVGLIITARNKMRSSKDIIARANFSKDIIETTVFSIDEEKFTKPNIELIKELIERNKSKITNEIYPGTKQAKGLRDIEKSEIIWFLERYICVNQASKFDSQLIINWLNVNELDILSKWDIAFAEGSQNEIPFNYGNDIIGPSLMRKVYEHGGNPDYYKNSGSRLGSPSDGRYGLTAEKVEAVKKIHKEIDDEKSISQKEYFMKYVDRKPILIIYNIVPTYNEQTIISSYLPLISVGIPELDIKQAKYIEYRVNKIYQEIDNPENEEE